MLNFVDSNLFLDIGPLALEGALSFIPKYHAEKLHEVRDEYYSMIVVKKIAVAVGCENYNILQIVPYIHFHMISKPSESDSEVLVIRWPTQQVSKEELAKLYEELQDLKASSRNI
ncbi:hypothetical protein JAAARDRAFT_143716 [Jaapia argillacea MUCL 33604]|uniref:HIT domain-containing protein n=1 Tax=Jaapia argillacea MUCL 33604 TaxID=933084 RepID=A0A067P5X2_9AGAM|nr:hypothetical protein JAAARDRAFT_143716 [Jaapia argillacea MUCL 33604]